jgi:hypothetical protein
MPPDTPLLVLPPRFSTDSVALWRAATALGWDAERLHGWEIPGRLRERRLAIYGETFFVEYVAQQTEHVLIQPTFDWLPDLPERYRRRAVGFSSLEAARNMDGPLFFKPTDNKEFVARVYASGADLPGDDVLPGDTPVLYAEPVTWEVEFRCFIRERRIATISPYLRGGELAQAPDGSWPVTEQELQEVAAFAADVLQDPEANVPPACTLDVGVVRDRGWAVVEANPVWAAGIYGCDPIEVLRVVERSCVPVQHLAHGDRRWIVGSGE